MCAVIPPFCCLTVFHSLRRKNEKEEKVAYLDKFGQLAYVSLCLFILYIDMHNYLHGRVHSVLRSTVEFNNLHPFGGSVFLFLAESM